MANDFTQLRAYQLARHLSASVYAAVQEWRHLDQRTVGVQAIRAADSVGANIAEATGRWHNQDQRRLLLIARGSLKEAEHWILVAQERGLMDSEAHRPVAEIARLLNGLIKKRSDQGL
ncbi:MAG TPA: four helix bundle protein [Thermoleophilaceae bacterium]|nr:four helix bundle protein [Thermoleophilaceae bacterium]